MNENVSLNTQFYTPTSFNKVFILVPKTIGWENSSVHSVNADETLLLFSVKVVGSKLHEYF